MLGENLLRYKEDQKYIVFDFESCHLNLGSLENKPWQLGLLVCQGSKELERFNLYIKWDKLLISPEAARVTKFDWNVYNQKARDAKECLDILESYLYNPEYKCLYHNGLQFDTYLHTIFRQNLGLKPDYSYLTKVIDSNAVAKAIKLGFKYDGKTDNDFLCYQYRAANTIKKGLKTNLAFLGKENNIPFDYDNLHDGLNDCKLLFLIWNKWIKWNIEI